MRRPSPLPPSTGRTGPAPARGAEAAAEEVSPRRADPVEGQTTQTAAPVIPLLPTAPAEPTAETGEDASDPPEPEQPVGVRDVWRAARARRRALRSEVRRFTARQRRRRRLWLGTAAAVIILVLGTLGAAYSPLFGVETIRVAGAEQLDEAAIREALAGQVGKPLPLVDESSVKAALVAFPLIETYSLEARPPHELVVRIVERTPVGLIESAAGYSLVDAAGVVLSTSEKKSSDVPLITVRGGIGSDAFSAVGQVMRSLPETISAQVTEVSATSPDDVTLTLGGSNAEIVWGSAEESAKKAEVLEKIMAARPPADVFTYDVSSPDAVVVR